MKSAKPLLFICGGLMATATLVGAIDYSQTSKSGKLKDLYKDEPLALHAVPIVNKEIDVEDYSRGPIQDREAYVKSSDEAVLNAVYKEKKEVVKRKQVTRKNSKKLYFNSSRKVRFDDFSRGPIRMPKEEKIVEDSALVVSQ